MMRVLFEGRACSQDEQYVCMVPHQSNGKVCGCSTRWMYRPMNSFMCLRHIKFYEVRKPEKRADEDEYVWVF